MILFHRNLCLVFQPEFSWKQAKTFRLGTPSLPSVPLILLFFLDKIFLQRIPETFCSTFFASRVKLVSASSKLVATCNCEKLLVTASLPSVHLVTRAESPVADLLIPSLLLLGFTLDTLDTLEYTATVPARPQAAPSGPSLLQMRWRWSRWWLWSCLWLPWLEIHEWYQKVKHVKTDRF